MTQNELKECFEKLVFFMKSMDEEMRENNKISIELTLAMKDMNKRIHLILETISKYKLIPHE